MMSTQLSLQGTAFPVTGGALDRGLGQRLLQVEARCALYAMERYYWLVDIAPVLLRYQAQQWWRDAKRGVGYLAADLMETFYEWLE
jgi:hypothetical protein